MKIGVRAHDYGKMSVEKLITAIKKDGYNNIQLAIPKAIEGIQNIYEVNQELLSKIKDTCEREQVEISVFGCYIEPAIVDEAKREMEIEKFIKGIEIAKALGAHCIGTETTRFEGTEEEREEAFLRLVDSVKKMIHKAEEVGIDIGIEPVARHTLATPQLTKRLLKEIGSPRLKIIFDPVNLITAQNIKEQEQLWDECLEIFGDKICAMHIKGIRLNSELELEKVELEEAQINFSRLIQEVSRLHPKLYILKEEAVPARAKLDQVFIEKQLR